MKVFKIEFLLWVDPHTSKQYSEALAAALSESRNVEVPFARIIFLKFFQCCDFKKTGLAF